MSEVSFESIEPPANVLLVKRATEAEAAIDCQHSYQKTDEIATVRISFSSTHIEEESTITAAPAKRGQIVVGDIGHQADDTDPDFDRPVVIDAIDDPTNLTTLGIAISRFCKHWGSTHQLVICFQSLDAVIRHTTPETAFQFTYVVLQRLSSVDALAHFHLDPTPLEDAVRDTFASLFDDVLVDERTQETITEATDEEVAAVLADWDTPLESPASTSSIGETLSEATDEEIAQLLEG